MERTSDYRRPSLPPYPATEPDDEMTTEYVVSRGGYVIDGLGRDKYPGDVVVQDGRISEIVPPGAPASGSTVDVSGLVGRPGFIDLHAPSDLAVLADRDHMPKWLKASRWKSSARMGSAMLR